MHDENFIAMTSEKKSHETCSAGKERVLSP
jgi:hypothetical protein